MIITIIVINVKFQQRTSALPVTDNLVINTSHVIVYINVEHLTTTLCVTVLAGQLRLLVIKLHETWQLWSQSLAGSYAESGWIGPALELSPLSALPLFGGRLCMLLLGDRGLKRWGLEGWGLLLGGLLAKRALALGYGAGEVNQQGCILSLLPFLQMFVG